MRKVLVRPTGIGGAAASEPPERRPWSAHLLPGSARQAPAHGVGGTATGTALSVKPSTRKRRSG